MGGALVCAFLLGRFTANQRSGTVAPGAGERAAPSSAQNVSAESSNEGGRKPAGDIVTTALADAAGKTVEEHARLMVTQKPGLARTALLENLLERVTADNWLEVFEVMWQARTEGMISEREQHWFLQRAGAVGGVAAAGNPLMEIVPKGERLVIEAQIAPHLIDKVKAGLPVDILFVAFNQVSTPHIPGTVIQVSADILADARQNTSFFKATVQVTDVGMALLQKYEVRAGMPVEVFVRTGERTAMNYLLKPLRDRMTRALTEP